MHALIIEDQPLIAEMIGVELAQLGYTSFDVVDREEDAVAAAQSRCPDLITADDRLASGTGIAAVEKICADRAIPVLFIVGDVSGLRRTFPGAGTLEKPFTIAALHDKVTSMAPCGGFGRSRAKLAHPASR